MSTWAGEAQLAKKAPMSNFKMATMLMIFIVLGTADAIVGNMLWKAYGENHAFFAHQGINILYVIYGYGVLIPRMMFTSKITERMRKFPQSRFVIMGVVDAFGTWFTSLGGAYTPGPVQTLLKQTLIPLTMFASWVFLHTKYRKREIVAATIIISGACISILPPLLYPDDTATQTKVRWYGVFFFFLSNIPMACCQVYKEAKFAEANLDVWYLTQMVSIYQFFAAFAFIPFMMIPGFGSDEGIPGSKLVDQIFGDGWECFMERHPDCEGKSTFWLLLGYCFLNMLFNTHGLYLTKLGSAVLNSIAYAILLPVSTLCFFVPFVPYSVPWTTWTGGFTLGGLAVVSMGFTLYQKAQKRTAADEALPLKNSQQAFHERCSVLSFRRTSWTDVDGAHDGSKEALKQS